MKKLLKSILAAALCAAMLVSATACDSGTSASSAAGGESQAASAADDGGEGDGGAASGGKVVISSWNARNADPELDQFAQCQEATGIEIEVNVIPESDYSSKLNQMIATNDNSIDVYVVWENDLGNFANVGGIDKLDDYLAGSDMVDTSDLVPAATALAEGLGGTYGLPWSISCEILYYNKDMFDAASIDYPTNDWAYEDFLAAAEALTVRKDDGTTDVYGCTLPNTQTWWAGIGGAGDQVYDPSNGQMVIGSGAEKFITDCATMVTNGVMPAPSSDTTDLFSAQRAAMSWAGAWNIGVYADVEGLNWDIATIPTDEVKYNTLHTGFYTINSQSANKEAAWTAIEWLMSEAGQDVVAKSGSMTALSSVNEKGEWKTAKATTVENWDAMNDSMNAGVFGYTCLPTGVTNNAISLFNSAVLGDITPADAVQQASAYAAETIGY